LSGTGTPSETRITIRYSSPEAAESILRAIAPDNLDAPEGMRIEAHVDGGTLNVLVVSNRGLGSLVSTLDDLLSCIQAAEAALKQLQ
jgi:tRNA threonylcarbamoyladenosine modification (KEOPS) complex  Pcc1 subunit